MVVPFWTPITPLTGSLLHADPHQRQKVVKPCFFKREDGVYIQLKYGSRVITLSKDGNAIVVKAIADVKNVLTTLREAVRNGELDGQIDLTIKARNSKG